MAEIPGQTLHRIVFARRQSPDWDALARDHEAGVAVDPSRYAPRTMVPGFPADIAACIRTWNDIFSVNFFRCRQTLKVLSERCLRQVRQSLIIPIENLSELPALVQDAPFLLFYVDDDDWFAPDTFERLSVLDFDHCDIAVFPLVRLGDKVFTFVRPGQSASVIIGERRDFGHRFQTNNYGITGSTALSDHLLHLRDHVLGSVYANEAKLRDIYFDVLVSATNKTPCSANTIGALTSDPSGYRLAIKSYVESLMGLPIPEELGWLAEPLRETINLFATI
jgi:hypothetical protein